MKRVRTTAALILCIFFAGDIYGQVFSQFEHGKSLSSGNVEVSANFSNWNDRESADMGIAYGVKAGIGISRNLDLKASFRRSPENESANGFTFLAFSPKYSFAKERLAFIPSLVYARSAGEFVVSQIFLNAIIACDLLSRDKFSLTLGLNYATVIAGGYGGGVFLGSQISPIKNLNLRPRIHFISPYADFGLLSYGLEVGYTFGVDKSTEE